MAVLDWTNFNNILQYIMGYFWNKLIGNLRNCGNHTMRTDFRLLLEFFYGMISNNAILGWVI